jgi:hypothetical protein
VASARRCPRPVSRLPAHGPASSPANMNTRASPGSGCYPRLLTSASTQPITKGDGGAIGNCDRSHSSRYLSSGRLRHNAPITATARRSLLGRQFAGRVLGNEQITLERTLPNAARACHAAMNDAHASYQRPPGEPRRIVDEPLFRFLIDFEVQKAQRLRYCISVICVSPDAAGDLLPRPPILEATVRLTRTTDAVASLSDSSLAMLLINADTTSLPAILARLNAEFEALTRVALTGRSATTWSAGGACYPTTAAGGNELLHQALALMMQARRNGGDTLLVAC